MPLQGVHQIISRTILGAELGGPPTLKTISSKQTKGKLHTNIVYMIVYSIFFKNKQLCISPPAGPLSDMVHLSSLNRDVQLFVLGIDGINDRMDDIGVRLPLRILGDITIQGTFGYRATTFCPFP